MEQTGLNTAAMLVGAILVGVLCGAAPLAAGFVKNKRTLGIIGFFSCVIGGVILEIFLAIPLAIIFTLVIVLKKSAADTNFNSPPPPPSFS